MKREEEEQAHVHVDFSSVLFPPDDPESEEDVPSFQVHKPHYYELYCISHIIIFQADEIPAPTASSALPPKAPSASAQTADEIVSRIDDSENVHMGDTTPAGTYPADELPAAPISEDGADISDIPQSFETSAVRDDFEQDVKYSEQCLENLQQRLPVLRRYLLATAREAEACNNLLIHYKASKEAQENRK